MTEGEGHVRKRSCDNRGTFAHFMAGTEEFHAIAFVSAKTRT
jgi:hypothetical protein